jgi:hypothetical protein
MQVHAYSFVVKMVEVNVKEGHLIKNPLLGQPNY